jgi:hypothetical protein
MVNSRGLWKSVHMTVGHFWEPNVVMALVAFSKLKNSQNFIAAVLKLIFKYLINYKKNKNHKWSLKRSTELIKSTLNRMQYIWWDYLWKSIIRKFFHL